MPHVENKNNINLTFLTVLTIINFAYILFHMMFYCKAQLFVWQHRRCFPCFQHFWKFEVWELIFVEIILPNDVTFMAFVWSCTTVGATRASAQHTYVASRFASETLVTASVQRLFSSPSSPASPATWKWHTVLGWNLEHWCAMKWAALLAGKWLVWS